MELYICSTYYHTLISILKAIDETEKPAVIICSYIPEYQNLAKKLEASHFFSEVIAVNNIDARPQTFKEKFLWRRGLYKKIVETTFRMDFSRFNEIYLFMDDTWIARYLKDIHVSYNILEDGLDAFKGIQNGPFAYTIVRPSLKNKVKRILKYGFDSYCYYLDEKHLVKSIEVNDITNIAIDGSDKRVIEKPRKTLYSKLTTEYLNRVVSVYLDNMNLLDIDNIVLVLTYPLFGDNLVKTLDEQMAIYSDICKRYALNYNVVIKPHPRDNLDYSPLSECKILPKTFPSELIPYIDDGKIKKYISVYSSSVYSYPKDKVVYYANVEEYIASEMTH